jgi:hypothetical protein
MSDFFFGVPLLPFLKLDASSSKELALSFYLDGFPCVTVLEQSVMALIQGVELWRQRRRSQDL